MAIEWGCVETTQEGWKLDMWLIREILLIIKQYLIKWYDYKDNKLTRISYLPICNWKSMRDSIPDAWRLTDHWLTLSKHAWITCIKCLKY